MRKKNKEKQKRKKGERVHRRINEKKGKGKERRKGKIEDFPALQRLKLDDPSTKVVTRNAIYMWIPKT